MKPQSILPHMPYHIKQNIVSHVDTLTKFSSLIRCSKEFKTLVDKSPVCFERISASLHNGRFTVDFWRTAKKKTTLYTSKHLAGDRFVDQSIENFMQCVENPNFSFRELVFSFFSLPVGGQATDDQLCHQLKNSLSSLGHQLSVKTMNLFLVKKEEHILSILPFLKPGTLEKLYFSLWCDDCSLEGLVNLRQWQQAKSIFRGKLNADYSKWNHLESCSFSVDRLTSGLVKSVIENFQQNANIKETHIWSTNPMDYEEIRRYLKPFQECFAYYRVPAPERKEYLEIKLGTDHIKVYRRLNH